MGSIPESPAGPIMIKMDERIKEFVEKYKGLSKKYKLPSLDELNNEFEIMDVVEEKNISPSFPLR